MNIDLGQDRFQQFYAAMHDVIVGVMDFETMTEKDERALFAAIVAMLARVVIAGDVFDPESAEITLGAMLKEHARNASERN